MPRNPRHLPVLALLLAALAAGGCILHFEAGMFQKMELHFALSETLEEGRSTLVHSILYPFPVEARKKWVRLAGVLEAPEGGALPDRIAVSSRFEDAESSQLQFAINKTARVAGDGSFKLQSKIKKDVTADTLQLVSVRPIGADLAEGTKIWLCIDIVAKRKDLIKLPDCGVGKDDGGDGGDGSIGRLIAVSVEDNAFEPKQVRANPGDTVRWTLTGVNLNHTVTAMDATVFDSGFLSTPGAFFEVTFDESHRDRTFEYSCVTHHTCCQMQGSIQVGTNAPEPDDGY